jgi:hypothetical protein
MQRFSMQFIFPRLTLEWHTQTLDPNWSARVVAYFYSS